MSTISEIRQGLHDDDLVDITEAVTKRRRVIGLQNFATIQTGTQVRFVDTIRPTYLAGATATVVGKKVSKLIVRLDRPVGRFSGGDLRVSATLVEVVPIVSS